MPQEGNDLQAWQHQGNLMLSGLMAQVEEAGESAVQAAQESLERCAALVSDAAKGTYTQEQLGNYLETEYRIVRTAIAAAAVRSTNKTLDALLSGLSHAALTIASKAAG